MSSTEAGTSMAISSLTFTWQARRQLSLISLREKWTVSVGRISPPPLTTCTLHWPQLPLPPQAEGRNTLLSAMVESRGFPELASTVVSLLMVMVTLPEWTRKCLAVSNTATSSRVMSRKMPTAERIVSISGLSAAIIVNIFITDD